MAASPPSLDTLDDADLVASGRRVFEIERAELERTGGRIGAEFAAACRLILGSRGRVVATGMGKSGHIARKIAATMRSTGRFATVYPPWMPGTGAASTKPVNG